MLALSLLLLQNQSQRQGRSPHLLQGQDRRLHLLQGLNRLLHHQGQGLSPLQGQEQGQERLNHLQGQEQGQQWTQG